MFRRLIDGLAAHRPRPTTRPAIPAQAGAGQPPPAPPDNPGRVPHHANSPLPTVVGGTVLAGTGIRKFVDRLPGLGSDQRGNLATHLPVAVADTVTYPGCDYYEIGVQQYAQRLHSDLPPTRLRGWRQLNHGTDADGRNTVAPPTRPYHLGPVIRAHRDRPVRVKLVNQLPTGVAGDLFLPVDTTVPDLADGSYPGNRTVAHLRGGDPPWISAGTPQQWFTPAGEPGPHRTGPGHATVPDMPDPGPGAVTLYYPNQRGARLGWFHDHSPGCARLGTYAGLVGLYLIDDPAERDLVARGVLPAEQVVLVIEDKTFVPPAGQLAGQDPTWDTTAWGGPGSLWFPHVYLPRQDPSAATGRDPVGRWDYAPWTGSTGLRPADPPTAGGSARPDRPWQPPTVPGTPEVSVVPDALHDTPLVNGVAYPYLEVAPRAYRLRILNACTDRTLNLQLYHAASAGPMWRADGSLADADAGEVPMVPARPTPGFPDDWPVDGRVGGVPDPAARGPHWYQIGSDGGLLPDVAVIPQRPVGHHDRRRDSTVLNVTAHALLMAPGERADVVVDLSAVPPGSNLILYNDCPAPAPRGDPRYDYHAGAPDRTGCGGAPPTRPGYGPNTRTLLQLRVSGTPAAPFDLAALRDPGTGLPRAYARSQPPPVVPQPAYTPAFGPADPGATRVIARDGTITVTPYGQRAPVTLPVRRKPVLECFETRYGRAVIRFGDPSRGTPVGYHHPPTEVLHPAAGAAPADGVQVWRISPQGTTTHPVHFPFCVQVVNRVARDGTVRPPDANELGWKDTVRVNPGEDTVVALRPTVPAGLPFRLPGSLRPVGPVDDTDPPGTPAVGPPADHRQDLGWEYIWHVGPVGHGDAGGTRPVVLRVCPARPTGLSATPVAGSADEPPSIVLAWTDNATRPAADGVLVERAADPGFTGGVSETLVPAPATGHTDTAVTPGVTWYYRIRAVSGAGYSDRSEVASAVVRLSAPTDVTGALPPAAPLRTTLTWVNRSFAGDVEVQRATNATFTAGLVTICLPVAVSYTDPALAPETTYYYRVRTGHRGAVSPWSTVATVRTPAAPPPPEALVAAVRTAEAGTVRVDLRWSVPSASVVGGFTLHRTAGDDRATPATFTLEGAARTFTDAGLARGVDYRYRLRAYNAAGVSAYTEAVADLD
jgi:FtsP/CotA-like multicopper oxidase with cupredoxin domain